MKQKIKAETKTNRGITLITLVITIVVILILSAVAINVISGDNGVLQKAALAKRNTEKAQEKEIDKLDEIGGIMTDFKSYYNSTKGCNSPKLTSGLTPVNYNSTKKVWEKCSKENWDWDYKAQTTNTASGGTSKWANAMSEDGSLWVWIPRFAYQIKSGYHQSAAGEIDIVFLIGATNTDESGKTYSTSYNMQDATTNGRMSDFVVHPAFGSNTDMGGWSYNIPGFWVAKFEAGYVGTENATSDPNSIDLTNVRESNVVYTSNKHLNLTTEYGNIYGNTIPNETKMKYPVFKAGVFSYTSISAGDAYGLAKSLNSANNPYGFSSNSNTHMMKNSEWGAVAYLTHSKYGRKGTEVTINNYLVPKPADGGDRPASQGITFGAKTGYCSTAGVSAGSSNTNVTLYNEGTGYLASSTGNITGVFDLSGGANEYVAVIALGLNDAGYTSGTTTYKSTSEYYNEYGSYLLAENNSKYKSILSIDTNYATKHSNVGQMANYSTHNNIFGDAMWEISYANNNSDLSGNAYAKKSWFSDYSIYSSGPNAFLYRGGKPSDGAQAGVFSFRNQPGNLTNSLGFRACVVSPD